MTFANPSKPADYINHMLEAITLATAYTDGYAQAEFLADRKTQQAVLMNILVIGEAAGKLARNHPDFIAAHPDVPWNGMRGMRNRLAHGYFDIDFDIVWHTVCNDLPLLADKLKAVRENG